MQRLGMKSHALAKKLLAMPDLPVVMDDAHNCAMVDVDEVEIVEHPYKVGAKAVRIA